MIGHIKRKMFRVICGDFGKSGKQGFSLITPSVLIIEQSSKSASMTHLEKINDNSHKQTCRVHSASSVQKLQLETCALVHRADRQDIL